MLDLHIHTFFSDGEDAPHSFFQFRHRKFAITDHNSVMAASAFSPASETLLVGCEITVNREPDILVYFPQCTDTQAIESALRDELREPEARIIRACYECLGLSNWERDLSLAFPRSAKIHSARTRDLAAMLYLYRHNLEFADGYFTKRELLEARKTRDSYDDSHGSPIGRDYAFHFARRYAGIPVLAHPIRTALQRSKMASDGTGPKEKLISLIESFHAKGGDTIEYEYVSDESAMRWNVKDLREMRRTVADMAEHYQLRYTIGSDAHSLKSYDSYVSWYHRNAGIVSRNLPVWL